MKEVITKTLMILGVIAIDICVISFCLWLVSWSFPIAFSMTLVCSVWGAWQLLRWLWKDLKD